MENINENSTVEENIETPVVEEVPEVVEAPVVTEPVIEAPVAEEPTAIDTSDFGKSSSEPQAVGQVDSGAIGVTATPASPKPSKKAKIDPNEETVAVKSTKNVSWPGVGKVYVGINIVTKSAADQWVTRSHITLATPEEVAKAFGK